MVRLLSPFAVVLALLVLTAQGCTEPKAPAEVSGLFWQGVREQDENLVRRHSTDSSAASIDGKEAVLPVGAVSFGRTIIDNDRAWVETTVEVLADEPVRIPLRTELVMEEGAWRVDYDATVAMLRDGGEVARVFGDIRSLTDRFADEAEAVLDDVQRALPEVQRELRSLEDRLRTRLPELQRRLEDLGRELEKAIKEKPEERRKGAISV